MQILIFPLPPLHSTTSSTTSSPPFPPSFPLFLSSHLPSEKSWENSRTPKNTANLVFLLPAILHTYRKEKGRRCLKTPYLWAFIEVEGEEENTRKRKGKRIGKWLDIAGWRGFRVEAEEDRRLSL
ncbi:MAG: hypothetical protein NC413_08655 [Muribaculum sp.]|nr:hypothetical protein [Muribaculum sp.]